MNEGEREQIAKLEALLARVRSRSRAPRPRGGAPVAKAPSPLASLASGGRGASLEIPTPVGAFHPSPIPPPPAQPLPPTRAKHGSRPEFPAALFAPKPATSVSEEDITSVDAAFDQTLNEVLGPLNRSAAVRPEPLLIRGVDPPPMEVVELEVDPDPSEAPPSIAAPPPEVDRVMVRGEVRPDEPSGPLPIEEPLESRSRLVSAPPVSASRIEVERDDYPGQLPSDPTIEVVAAEVSRAELDALEAEAEADRAPSSSRRPISMEEKMNEPDDDIVPLHAPPPESGRLPAASPAFELSFETGARLTPDMSFPQVAVAPATPRVTVVPAAPAVNVAPGTPQVTAVPPEPRVAPLVTRPEPAAETAVALFVGQAPAALAPKSFGELLDDALSF